MLSSRGLQPTKTLRASCHCKRSTFTVTIPTSSFPLTTYFCHCYNCRHTHGTLCAIHTSVPARPAFHPDTFTTYKTSDPVTRYFCSTCGCQMLDSVTKDGGDEEWIIATSLVEDGEEELWRFTGHYFLETTGDGGIGALMKEINGVPQPAHNNGSSADDTSTEDASKNAARTAGDNDDDVLHASCHCKGVQFTIARPPPNASEFFPPEMRSADPHKWFALFDACDTCRLNSGAAMMPWTFPLTSSITLPDGASFHIPFGTLKVYKSSAEVTRTFCGTCGATVTLQWTGRPEAVDVAVGVLEGGGVRNEDWLDWRTHRLAFEEDAKWKGVKNSLKEGLKDLEDRKRT